jgi:hypothetical protein
MEPYRVFISSVLNPLKEDLNSERDAARAAVEHFAPITRAWAFEAEPASSKPLDASFLDEVKTCDLIVLLIGRVLTQPTRAEYDTALDYGKPILVFCKEGVAREPEAAQLMGALNSKYDRFANAVEVREKLRTALGHELLRLIRGDASDGERPGDRIAQLRRLAKDRAVVRVSPLVPHIQYDRFRVSEIPPGTVILDKESSDERVRIPSQRVSEILSGEPHEPPILLLNGRLQWLTLAREWQFFPESLDQSDGLRLGIPKDSSQRDPHAYLLSQQLEKGGRKLSWSNLENVPARLNGKTHEVFYDIDGRYLRQRGPDRDSVALVSAL